MSRVRHYPNLWIYHRIFRQTAQTLPRSAIHAKNIRETIESRPDALVFPLPSSRRNGTQKQPVGPGGQDSDVFAETSDMLKARQRSQSVGALLASQEAAHHFTSTDMVVQDPPLSPSFVSRPPRKSSLVPIREAIHHSGVPPPSRPPLPRVSSASSLRTHMSQTLRPKRSMPELDRIWEGFLEDANETLSPTRRDFNAVKEVEITHVTRPRSGSTVSYDRPSSKQRFSDLPKSPTPPVTLPLIPNAIGAFPVIDLMASRKSYFPPEFTSLNLPPASPIAHLQGRTSPSMSLHSRFSSSEDGRPSTSDSTPSEFTSEVTLSMFPKPPPLNLRHISRPPTPSQYQSPLTPEYTPTVTPTSTTFSSHLYHVRRPSPPTSILKKTPGYYSTPPTPPITPNSSGSLQNSNGSLSAKAASLEPLVPTLKIRNSSPHLSTTALHSAHRPTSSDSSSRKSPYAVTPEREYNLRQQLLSRTRVPAPFEIYAPESRDDIRPHSPETDSQGVQWGYAV